MKDKIYLNIHPDWTEGENEPEVTWSEVEDPFYNNIPYIRKDALLEWAKGLYEKTMTFVQGDAIVDHAIQLFALNIKKHIESL